MKRLGFWLSQLAGGVGVLVLGGAIAALWTLALLLLVVVAALFSIGCVAVVAWNVFAGNLRVVDAGDMLAEFLDRQEQERKTS